jgi:hypothetical protein
MIVSELISEDEYSVQNNCIVDGYINLDEVLDYFQCTFDLKEFLEYELSDIDNSDITVINYINGDIRYVLTPLEEFNRIYINYKKSLNTNIIRRRLN